MRCTRGKPETAPRKYSPQIPPQIIDAREPTSAPVELMIQSMAPPMNISSCEQSTVQNQGGGDRHTSVGGRPPDVLSLQYNQDSNSGDGSAFLKNQVLSQYSPSEIPHKQRAGAGISNVVDGQQFSHSLLCQTSWLDDHTLSRPPLHPPDNVDVAPLGAD